MPELISFRPSDDSGKPDIHHDKWQQLLRVRNLYLLSCAGVPRIVLIILAYYKCIYNIYRIIL